MNNYNELHLCAYRPNILIKVLVTGKSITERNAALRVVSLAQGGSSKLESPSL